MNYLREIMNIIGSDSLFKGRVYPESYIRHIKTNYLNSYFYHSYKVKSENNNNWYNVEIINNGRKIIDYSCNCVKFRNSNTCKHVGAVLCHHLIKIYSFEKIDEVSISNSILNKYNVDNTYNPGAIKKKVNVKYDFEFERENVSVRINMGLNKLYVINSESKFTNVMDAIINNDRYVMGKNFTLDMDENYFDDIDLKILYFLNDYKQEYSYYYHRSSPFEVSYREFDYLLTLLEDKTFSIYCKGYHMINKIIYEMPTKYYLSIKNDNYILDIDDYKNYILLDYKKKYVAYNNTLCVLDKKMSEYLDLLERNKLKLLTFNKKDISKFSNGLFKRIKNNLMIDENIEELKLPTKPNVKLYFDIKDDLECRVIFDYNGVDVNYFDKSDILRDSDEEEKVIHEISEYGFISNEREYILSDEDYIYDFINNNLRDLTEKYEVFTSKKIDNTKIVKKSITDSNFTIGQDGIMSYSFSVEGIDNDELVEVFNSLKKKKRYYKLKNNNIISLTENEDLNELNNLFNDLNLSNKDILDGNIEIPKYRALYIDSLKKKRYKNIKTNNLFDEFIDNFKKYKNMDISFDDFDEKILRDYQKDGVKWLTTIYKCDLGGILADEMGLGKSIQTISFIKQVLHEKKDAKILIVAPTSLIYNWKNEFDKFGSNLKYIVVAENKIKRKEILADIDNYNIFITTYGLIRNDNDAYENINFEICVIDEAQMIKNYQAGMTREVKKIKAKCKIALTGTPVENNVTELWSIFDFIMPGYLNSISKFKERYNIKDVTEEDIKVLKNLNYQILPFILRRKKAEVAKSLPDKIENNIYLDLPMKQKMLYMKELNDTRKEIDELVGSEGFQKSRMKILQLLMKLRQICIDPSVMYENYDGDAIKLESLVNIVMENKGEHKILIFSSFKRVLDNVKMLFDKNKISYYMIDGSTKSKDRMEMVDSFNNDDTNCFLITLKSGGTGLNLVGADIVIHLDIWWNPQVENQATDRAHRIGQEKKVTVIKMITKGTIEERIIELQEKKKILSDNLIEGKSSSENLSSLTEKDIKNLLSTLED